MIQTWLAKIGGYLLPILLDWILGKATKAVKKQREKFEKDKEKGKIDGKNLKKLQECEGLEACIIAAKDAYNRASSNRNPGMSGSPEVSKD